MSSVAATSAVRSTLAATTDSESTLSRIPQKNLGQSDFLKLLATQFQMQDPMKPVEDTAFIAQMAQFSALEQASATSKEMAALRADQLRVTANSYLGHRVTVNNADGKPVTADVTAVDASGSEPKLVIAGETYPLSAVLRVEPGVISVPQSAPSGGA
ncbi:MAG: flagellar hook assembly protein FlgD [Verrucomicrobia bacterium]|jgi:flagellar basal-body rod modification protein FlgD|nr:flagellar hook assembly protein FlgD [Verrucomicrobiota bacterium]